MASASSLFSVAFSYAFPTSATNSFTVPHRNLDGRQTRTFDAAFEAGSLGFFACALGAYLAEEMTSLCLSESRILARWDATESAYWVMWTCGEAEHRRGDLLPSQLTSI